MKLLAPQSWARRRAGSLIQFGLLAIYGFLKTRMQCGTSIRASVSNPFTTAEGFTNYQNSTLTCYQNAKLPTDSVSGLEIYYASKFFNYYYKQKPIVLKYYHHTDIDRHSRYLTVVTTALHKYFNPVTCAREQLCQTLSSHRLINMWRG